MRGCQIANVEELVRLWLFDLLDYELPLLFGCWRALKGEKSLLLFLYCGSGLLLPLLATATALLYQIMDLAVSERACSRNRLSVFIT